MHWGPATLIAAAATQFSRIFQIVDAVFFPHFFAVHSRWAAATAMANCAAFVCRLVRQFGSATQIAVGQVRVCVCVSVWLSAQKSRL